jgi:hypothetical protein
VPADKLDQKSEKRNQQSETFPQFQPLNSDQPTNKNHHTTTSKAALQHHGNLPDAAPKSPGDDQGTTQTRFLSAETTIILPAGRNGQKVKSQKGTESEYFPTPFPNPAPLIQANVVLKSHHLPSESAIGASTESIKCSTPRTNQTQTRPSINLKPALNHQGYPQIFLQSKNLAPKNLQRRREKPHSPRKKKSPRRWQRRRRRHCSRQRGRGNAAAAARSRAAAGGSRAHSAKLGFCWVLGDEAGDGRAREVTVDGGGGAAVQCGQWGCEPAGGGWSRGNESNGGIN